MTMLALHYSSARFPSENVVSVPELESVEHQSANSTLG